MDQLSFKSYLKSTLSQIQLTQEDYPIVEIKVSQQQIFQIKQILILVEFSLNSVRINYKFQNLDGVQNYIFHTLVQQIQENISFSRNAPIQNYNLSFVITQKEINQYSLDHFIDLFTSKLPNINKTLGSLYEKIKSQIQ